MDESKFTQSGRFLVDNLERQKLGMGAQMRDEIAQMGDQFMMMQEATTDLAIQNTGLSSTVKDLELKISEQESRLAFLSLPFDAKSAEPRGDVVFIVQGRTDEPLYADKNILCSKSLVFQNMFHTNMLEQLTETVRIDDTTLPILTAVVKFCYNAEIDFTEEVTAEEVLAVAHKYSIDLLQKICLKHLSDQENLTMLQALFWIGESIS